MICRTTASSHWLHFIDKGAVALRLLPLDYLANENQLFCLLVKLFAQITITIAVATKNSAKIIGFPHTSHSKEK